MQILPDPALLRLADIHYLAFQAPGTFQKSNAARCDIALCAQGRADQSHDQVESKVPRRLPCFTRAVENGITSRPVDVPPNQARGSCSCDSPLLTAKPRQHKDGPRVSGQEPDLLTRDEIERCYYKQRRRHLARYQGSWLPCKALCEPHRNKSAWIDCEEQVELATINKDALRSLFIATMCIA